MGQNMSNSDTTNYFNISIPKTKEQFPIIIKKRKEFSDDVNKRESEMMDLFYSYKNSLYTGQLGAFKKVYEEYDTKSFFYFFVKYFSYLSENELLIIKEYIPENHKLPYLSIFDLIPNLAYEHLYMLKDKIDLYALNKNKENILFLISNTKTLDKIIKEDKEFNINQINVHQSNFLQVQLTKKDWKPNFLNDLIDTLNERDFDFNHKGNFNTLLINQLISSEIFNVRSTMKLISKPKFDVNNDYFWIHLSILKDNDFEYLSGLLWSLLKRPDHIIFLNTLIAKYNSLPTSEEEIIIVIRQLASISNKKIISMINYKDPNGNTVLHYAAINGYKKLIRILNGMFTLQIFQNNDGLTPLDLYEKHKIRNILKNISITHD